MASSDLEKLRHLLDASDLRYLNSYWTKAFRLFKTHRLPTLVSSRATEACRRAAIERVKSDWSNLGIEQRLYYCQLANCFHSRSKLTLIKRSKLTAPNQMPAVDSAQDLSAKNASIIQQKIMQQYVPIHPRCSSNINPSSAPAHASDANLQYHSQLANHLASTAFSYYWPSPVIVFHPTQQQQQQAPFGLPFNLLPPTFYPMPTFEIEKHLPHK